MPSPDRSALYLREISLAPGPLRLNNLNGLNSVGAPPRPARLSWFPGVWRGKGLGTWYRFLHWERRHARLPVFVDLSRWGMSAARASVANPLAFRRRSLGFVPSRRLPRPLYRRSAAAGLAGCNRPETQPRVS